MIEQLNDYNFFYQCVLKISPSGKRLEIKPDKFDFITLDPLPKNQSIDIELHDIQEIQQIQEIQSKSEKKQEKENNKKQKQKIQKLKRKEDNLKCNIFTQDFINLLNQSNIIFETKNISNECNPIFQTQSIIDQDAAYLGIDTISRIVSHFYGFSGDQDRLDLQLYLEVEFYPRQNGLELLHQYITQKQAIVYAKLQFKEYILRFPQLFNQDIRDYLQ